MNIIITGCSQGIGFETAKLLAESGHTIFALSRNERKLKRLKALCPENIVSCPTDLSNQEEVGSFVGHLHKSKTSIHRLINNAGLLINKAFDQFTEQEAIDIFNINFFAPSFLIQKLLPVFANDCHIVNISSMGGFQSSAKFPGLSFYSASKAAIAVMSECLAEELKEKKISVNSLALGAVQTEMLSEAFPGYTAPTKAEEIAEFIAHFCINGNKFFNGKCLPVSSTTP